jgi:uncharacterized protein YqgC (DUF456 family)
MSGWGRFTWGQAYWGEDDLLATGWGAKPYGTSNWGDLSGEVVSLTGLSISTNIELVTVTGTAVVDLIGEEFNLNIGSVTNVIDVNFCCKWYFIQCKYWNTYNRYRC